MLRAAGVERAGVLRRKLPPGGWGRGIELLADSRLEVAYLVHAPMYTLDQPAEWEAQTRAIHETIDAAVTLGTDLIYGTTGTGGALSWEDASDGFVAAVSDAAGYATEHGVRLLLESTNPQFADIDILHNLADTLELAVRANLDVCFDLHATWTARDLRDTVRRARGRIGLAQIADYVPGSRAMDRSVPGDGIIPLERIVGWLLEDGYCGSFDVEVFGVPDEDPIEVIRRSKAALSTLLERLGA
jgi:sugar phosphate isomerase/epimerase